MSTTCEKTADINKLLEKHERKQGSLIPILQDVQKEVGYLPMESISAISRYLKISEAEVYGVVTFYAQFRFKPIGENVFTVCRGTACHVRGSQSLIDELQGELGIPPGETTEDMKFTIQTVACVGSCALAPLVVVNDKIYGRVTKSKMKSLVKQLRENDDGKPAKAKKKAVLKSKSKAKSKARGATE